MSTLKIIAICYSAFCYLCVILSFYNEYKNRKKYGTLKTMEWSRFALLFIFAPIALPILFIYDVFIQNYIDELQEARKPGGYKKYKEWKKQKKLEWEQEQERLKAEHEKSEKLRAAFLAGEIQRDDLPRLDGVNEFEFEEEMNLSVDYEAEVREIVYVENEYCDSLNDFLNFRK